MGAEYLSAERLKWADDCIKFEGEAAIPLSKHDYSTTWGLLMPVLEKICRMKIGDGVTYVEYATPRTFGMLNEETGEIMVRLNGFQCFSSDTLIQATWNAIVDFLIFEREAAVEQSGFKNKNLDSTKQNEKD